LIVTTMEYNPINKYSSKEEDKSFDYLEEEEI
jgi:hypothetical protein